MDEDYSEIKPDVLARAWVAADDDGRVYFANLITKEVTWDEPDGYQKPDESGWIELQDPQTLLMYYYNTITTLTEWSRPDGFVGNHALPKPSGDEVIEVHRRGSSFCSEFSSSSGSESSDSASSGSDDEDGDVAQTFPIAAVEKFQPVLELPQGPSEARRRARSGGSLDEMETESVSSATRSSVLAEELGNIMCRMATPTPESLPDAPLASSTGSLNMPSSFLESSRFACPAKFSRNNAAAAVPTDTGERELINNVYRVPTVVMESIEKLQLEGFASNNFKTHRRGIMRKVIPLNEMLKFSKDTISSSLIKFNGKISGLGQTAARMFSKIQSYMGDRSGRQKNPIRVAQRIIQLSFATSGHVELNLKDELFCQLAKQVTANPRIESCIKGWELISICLGVFFPTQQLLQSFEKFLYTGIASNNQEIRTFANAAKTRLDFGRDSSPRTQMPSTQEIEAAVHRTPMVVRIHMMDETFRAILISSYTTCEQAVVRFAIKSLIPDCYLKNISIYESRGGSHLLCLNPNEHICDSISSWEQAGLRTPEQVKFYCKIRLISREIVDTDSVVMVAFLFKQAQFDVNAGHYPVTEADVIKLGALQLQCDVGDYVEERQTPGTLANHIGRLEKYIPPSVMRNKKPDQWEKELYGLHFKLKDSEYTQMETMLSYLNFLKKWPFHSASFYMCEEADPETLIRFENSSVLLALNNESIFCLHPQTKMVQKTYNFSDICGFKQTPTSFGFIVGSINEKRNQRIHMFITPVGLEISLLAQDYIRCKLEEAIEYRGGFSESVNGIS